MKKCRLFALGFFAIIVLNISCGQEEKKPRHALFRLGFKTESFSTGPLSNSGFIFRLNDTVSPIFLTAHHVVAGYDGGNKYYQWFELGDKVKNAWLWCMEDTTYQLKLGENIQIAGAKTLHLDLAAFSIPVKDDIGYLKPSLAAAQVGDSVELFSKLIYEDPSKSIINPGKVIYATDSVLVYELIPSKLVRMSGSSGSPVLNKSNEVIAISYGGLALPNKKEIEKIAQQFPLINSLGVEVGKSYGIGVPVGLINSSLLTALKRSRP